MLILQPQRAFPIVRQIANHLDATTYYVQAVVRDADGVTLSTVQLDAKGNQRYQKKWQVPVDRSGQGSYVSIVTSVYTDVGYTTKSANYGDEETTYLIFDRVMPAMRGGGVGNNNNLSASDVRSILKEELDKREPKPIKFPEFPEFPEYEMRWGEVLGAISMLQGSVNQLPKENPDLEPIKNAMMNLARMVDDKEVTPEADMKPVVDEIQFLGQSLLEVIQSGQENVQSFIEQASESVKQTVISEVDNIEFSQETVVRKTPKTKPDDEAIPQEQAQIDISELV